MATKKDSLKLIDILKEGIKKTDNDKALEAANREVKAAKKKMQFEVATAEETVDAAKDNLERVIRNTSSSANDILTAERNVVLAEKNLADMTEIFEGRF